MSTWAPGAAANELPPLGGVAGERLRWQRKVPVSRGSGFGGYRIWGFGFAVQGLRFYRVLGVRWIEKRHNGSYSRGLGVCYTVFN